MTAALLLLAAFVLVVAYGIFVATEFAFLAADRSAVERLAANGDQRAARTFTALRHLSTQLSGVQIGITITNLVIGLLAEPSLAILLEGPITSIGLPDGAVPTIAVTIALIASTVVTMVLGELVPRNLAIAMPIKVAGCSPSCATRRAWGRSNGTRRPCSRVRCRSADAVLSVR